eukprot:3617575-Lingulodinium_polyedra.AAC.1
MQRQGPWLPRDATPLPPSVASAWRWSAGYPAFYAHVQRRDQATDGPREHLCTISLAIHVSVRVDAA